jgi:hypothetical protein
VRVCPDGTYQELVSWPSWGPQEDEAMAGALAVAGALDDTHVSAAAAPAAPSPFAAAAATAAANTSRAVTPTHARYSPQQGSPLPTGSSTPPSPRFGSIVGKAATALAAAVTTAAAAGSSGGASSNTGGAALCVAEGGGADEATGGRGVSR